MKQNTQLERDTTHIQKRGNVRQGAEIALLTAGFWGPAVVDLTFGLGLRYPEAVPHWVVVGIFSSLFGVLWILFVGMVLALDEV